MTYNQHGDLTDPKTVLHPTEVTTDDERYIVEPTKSSSSKGHKSGARYSYHGLYRRHLLPGDLTVL